MDDLVDLVLHPVRMRIIMTLVGRELTAQQLAQTLGDVSPATLYRHLNRLTEAGVLAMIAERRVRGTLEKVYALNRRNAQMDPQAFAALSREDHLRYFTTFVASLLGDFSRYVRNAQPFDILTDGVGYQKFPIELSDEEFTEVVKGMNAAILPYLNNPHTPERKRRIFATMVMPDLEGDRPEDRLAQGEQDQPDKEKE